ncbi:acyltransferase family protein [Alkalihalobacillus sp. LMS39]|uniref:acyltransferase family protein n=1 Tax=Alkalihalobacillus sp. LMS39 TaxID=2924032 RepID=UPI001FB28949|nr:acyltransferase family protein [Alkalihalobacillus sp. LMS39]UOE95144.1 acyltransferase family protein [Alkalihalobacillus sp. LMS39]
MNKRLYYLDYLRVVITILVIVHHTAIAYGAGGDWIYKDVDESELTISMIVLTIFTAVNQSFFMGLFFFLSGYFTPGSYDRKGGKSFLKDRLLRLGIPLLVYLSILGPIITYIAHFKEQMSLVEYYLQHVITLNILHIGPMWFVETLIYFSLLYAVYRVLNKRSMSKNIALPTSKQLVIIALALGLVAFLVRLVIPVGYSWLGLQFGYFPAYILLFISGIIAYRQKWLEQISRPLVKTWVRISVLSIPLLPLAFLAGGALEGNMEYEGGVNLQAFVYAMWEPFVAFGIILWLLKTFEQKMNTPSNRKTILANAAYTVYIIHPVVIVGLSILLTGSALFPIVKFVIVSLLGTIVCFVVSSFIIKIPYARRIL